MKSHLGRGIAAASFTLAVLGSSAVLAGTAQAADPGCSDAVAAALHATHEAAGPAGGAVHVVEDAYCDVRP